MKERSPITFEELQLRVERWAGCVEGIARGLPQHVSYDEYLNDMDARCNTELALEHYRGSADPNAIKMVEEELKKGDAKLVECSEETVACIWREETAEKYGWNRESHWFYYRRPNIRLKSDANCWPDSISTDS